MVDTLGGSPTNDAVEALSGQRIDEHFAGAWDCYHEEVRPVASEIQYSQVWIPKRSRVTVLRSMVTKKHVKDTLARWGVYAQSDPREQASLPGVRLSVTPEVTVDGALLGSESIASGVLQATFVAPVSGFYWLAFVTDSKLSRWLCSPDYPAGFVGVAWEQTTGVDLPAVANASNQAGPLIWVGAKE